MNKKLVEKEIKILDISPTLLRKKILDIGGHEIQDGMTRMWWFDRNEDFQPANLSDGCDNKAAHEVISKAVALRKELGKPFCDSDVYFRVREQAEGCDLTVKRNQGISQGILINEEISYDFQKENLVSVRRCVEEAGFRCIAEHEKKRTSFSCKVSSGNIVRLDIDEWPGIPVYVEIEGMHEEDILTIVDLLDLSGNMISTEVGRDFFAFYGIQFFSNLKFDEKV